MPEITLHASAVAAPQPGGGWAGVLIRGPSGAGKSTLALRLMALGARLIADDQVRVFLSAADQTPMLASPAPGRPATHGVIEARGVGLIRFPSPLDQAPLVLTAELPAPGAPASPRLPGKTATVLLGRRIPSIPSLADGRSAAILYAMLVEGGAILEIDG